jgi:hypothetical protein
MQFRIAVLLPDCVNVNISAANLLSAIEMHQQMHVKKLLLGIVTLK